MFPSILGLSARNALRRPFRTSALLLCAAAVVGIQVGASVLSRAGERAIELGMDRLGADLVAVPRGLSQDVTESYITGEPSSFYMPREVLDKISSKKYVARTSPQLYLKSLTGASCCSAWNVFLIGFDPETDFTVRPWIEESITLETDKPALTVGAAIQSPLGTVLKFYGNEFVVSARLNKSGMGLDTAVFMPMEAAFKMADESAAKAEKTLDISRNTISAVLIDLVPEEDGGFPSYRAAFELENDITEISVVQRADVADRTSSNLESTLNTLRSSGFATWPVAALLAGLVFAMAVNERRREIGLLRSIGAGRAMIFGTIISEAVIIAGAGALLGAVLSSAIVIGYSGLIAERLSVAFYPPGPLFLLSISGLAVLLAVLTGAAAAFFPAMKASRMDPAEAMRAEG